MTDKEKLAVMEETQFHKVRVTFYDDEEIVGENFLFESKDDNDDMEEPVDVIWVQSGEESCRVIASCDIKGIEIIEEEERNF